MKKIMIAALGLSLLAGSTVMFAQDSTMTSTMQEEAQEEQEEEHHDQHQQRRCQLVWRQFFSTFSC